MFVTKSLSFTPPSSSEASHRRFSPAAVPKTEADHEEFSRRLRISYSIGSRRSASAQSSRDLTLALCPCLPPQYTHKVQHRFRLWTYGFHKLLESLRRASFSSPLALEHLQDFIYYAYSFYTGLQEEPIFRSDWLETLGDLARYRMVRWLVEESEQAWVVS